MVGHVDAGDVQRLVRVRYSQSPRFLQVSHPAFVNIRADVQAGLELNCCCVSRMLNTSKGQSLSQAVAQCTLGPGPMQYMLLHVLQHVIKSPSIHITEGAVATDCTCSY